MKSFKEFVNEENTYIAFHGGKKAEIKAPTSRTAHLKAIEHFKAKKAQHHMVTVHLHKRADGSEVTHTATN